MVKHQRTTDPDTPVKGRGRGPVCACRKTARVDTAGVPGAVTEFYGRTVEVCANCEAMWEPLPPGGAHLDDDGTPFPFPDPCDNCAFRPGSPEQQDVEGWKKLMAQLEAGATFHCHKGVPIVPESEHGFAYPGGGKPHPKLRLCRGFLQVWSARMRKGVKRLQEEEVEP
jgi:hypothetical protein